MSNVKAIGEALVAHVRQYISEQVEKLNHRAEAHSRRIEELLDKTAGLEERISAIPSGERGEKGDRGEKGETGRDGRDGLIGPAGERGLPGERGEQGPQGPAGERGEKGDRGEVGPQGMAGQDGRSVTIDDVRPLIEAAIAAAQLEIERRATDTLQRAIDRMPLPRDGTPGKDGRDGVDGANGKDGTPGKDGRDAFDLADAFLDHDGERSLTFGFRRGEDVVSKTVKLPLMIDRGVYGVGRTYEKGDGVTYGGDYWSAVRDIAIGEKPGSSDGWRLVVRKGRDGNRGHGAA